MAYVDPFSDEESRKNYHNSEDLLEIGVYCKRSMLNHKVDLVRNMDMARENFTDPIDEDGQEYFGVYWTVRFNKFGMDFQEFIEWRDAITKFDPVSMPMVVGYSGHLKRIWFASEKYWQGFFEVESVEGNDVFIYHWHPLENPEDFPRSSFQGYTTKVPVFEGYRACKKCGGNGMDMDRFEEFLEGKETYCKECKGHGFVQVVK